MSLIYCASRDGLDRQDNENMRERDKQTEREREWVHVGMSSAKKKNNDGRFFKMEGYKYPRQKSPSCYTSNPVHEYNGIGHL
jgi:hypothetical protein